MHGYIVPRPYIIAQITVHGYCLAEVRKLVEYLMRLYKNGTNQSLDVICDLFFVLYLDVLTRSMY